MTRDIQLSASAAEQRSQLTSGVLFGVLSAAAFGLSGSLASGLMSTGWSPGAVVTVRVALAALVVVPFGVAALAGRWHLLRQNTRLVVMYGFFAVAGVQFAFYSAVAHMDVGPALLIEYTAPAAVVVWLWLRHGQRPTRVTIVGATLAAAGLVLVLDLLSGGATLSTAGVLWALAAMVGAAVYFVISADEDTGVPPVTLAAAGLVVGSLALGLLGAAGVMPMRATTTSVAYAGHDVAWWVPLLVLGLVTAAIAYVTGVAAARRLGSRLASFIALLEVVIGVVLAWLLLDQLPGPMQFLGGVLILAGVVAVKIGEARMRSAAAARSPHSLAPATEAAA